VGSLVTLLAFLSMACGGMATEDPPALAATADSADRTATGTTSVDSTPGAGERAGPTAADAIADIVGMLPTPAAPGSRTPNLFATEDAVYLSWLEPLEAEATAPASTQRGRFALRFSTLEGDEWSAARTIAEGDDFFVNWADFPTLVASDGVLAAHWLRLNGGRGTAYDVMVTRSTDGGDTWSVPVTPHTDGTQTEHGFVSLVPETGGGFTAVWLDGRKYATAEDQAGREMTLRTASFDAAGNPGGETLLDGRICDCCQTDAAVVGGTLVVVYRDRSPGEVRDIYSVRRTDGGWQEPVEVATDGWQIPGCPVNGPAIAAQAGNAAVAWFTMRNGIPEVRAAFSHDAGASFSEPVLIDSGRVEGVDASSPRAVSALADSSTADRPIPLGRVDVVWTGPSHAAVFWMVARGAGAELMMRRVHVDGRLDDPVPLASTGSMRSSGFPRVARQGDRLVVAWTVPEDELRSLQTAAIDLARLQ
jgi:hypothetical protein